MPKKSVITKTMADVLFERLQATAEERHGYEAEAERCRSIESQIITLLGYEGITVAERPSGYEISSAGRAR